MTETKAKEAVTAGIIVIGDEILNGRTQDTNTCFIAQRLNEIGIALVEVHVIGDDVSVIEQRIRDFSARFTYVFTTGGIGPTHDDKTAQALAQAFDTTLELNDDAVKALIDHYGTDQLNDARKKMAYLPIGAKLIDNPLTAAPGIRMDNVFVMAGVPSIMQSMMEGILPKLEGGDIVQTRSVSCDNIPESVMAPYLASIEDAHEGVSIGSYPKYKDGVPGLSIVLRSTDVETLEQATQQVFEATEKCK